jgi:hypothetical protein
MQLIPVENNTVLMKLFNVMADVGWLPKDNKVDIGRISYEYTSEAQFVSGLRPLLIKQGLLIYPEDITDIRIIEKPSDKGVSYITTALYTYCCIDIENGHRVYVKMLGQGADSTDKGVYKCSTGALKYVLRQLFFVGTGDDPEGTDEHGNRVSSYMRNGDRSKGDSRYGETPTAMAASSIGVNNTLSKLIAAASSKGIDLYGEPYYDIFQKHGISFDDENISISVLKAIKDLIVSISSGKTVEEAVGVFENAI